MKFCLEKSGLTLPDEKTEAVLKSVEVRGHTVGSKLAMKYLRVVIDP